MGKKLPRRVMSMSKRAGKLVEDANALLHDAEEEEGDEEGDAAASPSAPTEEDRPPAWAYMGAWLAAVAFLLAIMLGGRLIFTVGTGEDTAALGVQTREVSEPEYQAARDALREPTPTIAPTTSTPVSRSGGATLGMVCEYSAYYGHDVCFPPDGTPRTPATIGGTTVPPLQCAEDEVIGFVGVPDTLECIQIDVLR